MTGFQKLQNGIGYYIVIVIEEVATLLFFSKGKEVSQPKRIYLMMMEFEEGSLDEYYYLVIKKDRAYNAYCEARDQHPDYQALEQAQREFREKDKDDWEEIHKALKVAKACWDIEEKLLPEHRKWVKYIFKVANHKLDFEDLTKLQMAEDWFENR